MFKIIVTKPVSGGQIRLRIAQTLGKEIGQRLDPLRETIDFFAVHDKQSGHLLGHFHTDSDQVGPGAAIVPEFARERFLRLWQGRLDSDHDPLQIVSRPERRVREDIVEGTKDGFGLVVSQVIKRQPKTDNATILQPAFHQRKKLLGVEIDRTGRLQRRRFASDNVVTLRTSL